MEKVDKKLSPSTDMYEEIRNMAKPTSFLRLQLQDAIPVLKVLSNSRRCQILEVVSQRPLSISDLAVEIGLDQGTVSQHVQMLEKVNLVQTVYVAGIRGQAKIIQPAVSNILLHMPTASQTPEEVQETEMPIGLYSRIEAVPPCGFATANNIIHPFDNPSIFHHPKRTKAENLWMKDGFIEYVFPNTIGEDHLPTSLDLSVEICSEIKTYKEDYPSDVTLWVNDHEIGTVRLPGDMGARYGRFTPAWVPEDHTKYGFMTHWSADEDGFWINAQDRGAPGTIGDLGLVSGKPIVVRLGFKDGDIHGGINLFGPNFGEFDQGIKLRLVAAPTQSPNERLLSEFREVLSSEQTPK